MANFDTLIREFNNELTPEVAIDCEMVEAFDGFNRFSVCAKVSIVNAYLEPVLDTYVKTSFYISDYRTTYSGIKPEHLKDAPFFVDVRSAVLRIINNRILIGHDLQQDLSVLQINHPRINSRDTCRLYYSYFKKDEKPSLKRLSKAILGIDIQTGAHDSLEDARASMNLYLCWSRLNDGKIFNLDEISIPKNLNRQQTGQHHVDETICVVDLSQHYKNQRQRQLDIENFKKIPQ